MRIRLLLTLLAAASAAQSGTEASGPQHVKARRWIWGLLQQPAGRALCGVDDVNAEEAHVLCTAEVGASVQTCGAFSGAGLLGDLQVCAVDCTVIMVSGHVMTATAIAFFLQVLLWLACNFTGQQCIFFAKLDP